MQGQGKFLTKAGEFWEGYFYRNSFLQHSDKWIDLAKEQVLMAIKNGKKRKTKFPNVIGDILVTRRILNVEFVHRGKSSPNGSY